MLTGRLPLVPLVRFGGVDTRDAAEPHVKALTDDRAEASGLLLPAPRYGFATLPQR